MDHILNSLSDYGTSLSYERLAPNAVHSVKRRVIDTLGCAMGAYSMEPPQVARAHALEAAARPGATVLGTRHRTTPELAAFANGVMARYLDFNDTSAAGKTGHPSDNIMGVLAAAEYAGADMETAIAGIVLAYEVQDRFGEAGLAIFLHDHGWDHVVSVAISVAAGASKALGLGKEQTANALALAATSNMVTRQTRIGQLSMWKGCAAGNASRNGVFAALMARRGLTGPAEAFEGYRGFLRQLGTTLELPAFGGDGRPFTVETDKFKYYPCDYEAQCSITPALELHKALSGRVDDIEKVDVETYSHAVAVAADTRDKWDPTSRETADHSIPYVVAIALTRGTVWFDDFTGERIGDLGIRALMQKVAVRSTAECDSIWPDACPFRITVTTKSGQKHSSYVRYAKGHPKNPMSDQEIEAKFRRLAEPVMGPARVNKALDRLWRLEEMKSLRAIFNLFVLD